MSDNPTAMVPNAMRDETDYGRSTHVERINPGDNPADAHVMSDAAPSRSELMDQLAQGNVKEAVIKGGAVHVTFADGRTFEAPEDPVLIQRLNAVGVAVTRDRGPRRLYRVLAESFKGRLYRAGETIWLYLDEVGAHHRLVEDPALAPPAPSPAAPQYFPTAVSAIAGRPPEAGTPEDVSEEALEPAEPTFSPPTPEELAMGPGSGPSEPG